MTITPSRAPQSGALPLDGWIEEGVHNYLLRVQYEDTDLGGIIYHANYLKFAERARSSYLRCLGISQEEDVEGRAGGHAFVVRHAEIDFRKTAGLGVVLCVSTKTTKLSRLRLTLEQTIKNQETGLILAGVVVDIVYVGVDGKGEAVPTRMPNKMMDRLTGNHQGHDEK
jgi:acyl-CoA thioester hydrolase